MQNSLQHTIQRLVLAALVIFAALPTWAQSTNASFIGTIQDEKGQPLPGVTIQVRNESTGFRTATATQTDGRYQLRQLPLGGPYTVTVSMVGYATQKREGLELNQGDQVTVKFDLKEDTQQLQEVTIKADRLINQVQQFGASTSVNAAQIKNLPLEGRNFAGLVSLSPLAGSGLSLGGARSGTTNITIDGGNGRSPLWAGPTGVTGGMPYAISQEAIREFSVATNDYDVTQGRQTGGSVNAVTKFGTNTLSGSAFTFVQNDRLQSKYDIRGVPRTASFDRYQWGFSLGGAIVKDKLHFFTAFDRQDQTSPVVIADINNAEDEARFGIRKDTLDKFMRVARQLYGLGSGQQVGQFTNKTTANTLFVRLDWTLNDKQKLTFRNNLTSWNSPINSGDNSDIVMRESYNTQQAQSYTGLLSLRSAISPKFTNEVKLQYQYEYTAQTPSSELPASNIPRAIVSVRSPFPTATNPNATTTRTVQLGGQRFTPEKTLYHQFQLLNTSYLTTGKYNWTFGTDTYFTMLDDVFTSELNGRFIFDSMRDFELQRPSRYVREVYLGQGEPWVSYNVIDWAFFGQVETNISQNINLVAGLRWDGTSFLTGPAANPRAEQLLGIKTDRKPTDWNNFQPRFQLTWNIGGKNTDILKVGGGAFAAQAMYYNIANNMLFDGQKIASIDVTGITNPQMPRPNFPSYRNDPSTAPGVPAGQSFVSTINTTGPDFQVPTSWKFNVSYNKIMFNDRLRLGLNFVYTNTYNNYVYLERNLVENPYFRLSNEANRGVFVPANRINTTTGRSDWQDSRATTQLGRVLELNSIGYAEQWAFFVDATYKIGKDGYLNASYTLNDTKDNSTYNCCVANTSTFLPVVDDPRALNWGYSEQHFRHKLVINGATPTWKGFNAGFAVRGLGGTPFSIHTFNAGFGINGDFNDRNDLAFLYDPNRPETDPTLAAAIKTWLDNPDVAQYAKDYYLKYIGQVAPRNAGVNPFAATIDLRATKNFKLYKKQSLEITADLFNVANLFDRYVGRNRNLGAEQRLFTIAGFDNRTNNYRYRVNATTSANPVGGTPWRLQLGARYVF